VGFVGDPDGRLARLDDVRRELVSRERDFVSKVALSAASLSAGGDDRGEA
jgi:hypothetical protein